MVPAPTSTPTKAKAKPANKIINDKGLDIEFRAITFTTYGGSTHALTNKVTSEAQTKVCNCPSLSPVTTFCVRNAHQTTKPGSGRQKPLRSP